MFNSTYERIIRQSRLPDRTVVKREYDLTDTVLGKGSGFQLYWVPDGKTYEYLKTEYMAKGGWNIPDWNFSLFSDERHSGSEMMLVKSVTAFMMLVDQNPKRNSPYNKVLLCLDADPVKSGTQLLNWAECVDSQNSPLNMSYCRQSNSGAYSAIVKACGFFQAFIGKQAQGTYSRKIVDFLKTAHDTGQIDISDQDLLQSLSDSKPQILSDVIVHLSKYDKVKKDWLFRFISIFIEKIRVMDQQSKAAVFYVIAYICHQVSFLEQNFLDDIIDMKDDSNFSYLMLSVMNKKSFTGKIEQLYALFHKAQDRIGKTVNEYHFMRMVIWIIHFLNPMDTFQYLGKLNRMNSKHSMMYLYNMFKSCDGFRFQNCEGIIRNVTEGNDAATLMRMISQDEIKDEQTRDAYLAIFRNTMKGMNGKQFLQSISQLPLSNPTLLQTIVEQDWFDGKLKACSGEKQFDYTVCEILMSVTDVDSCIGHMRKSICMMRNKTHINTVLEILIRHGKIKFIFNEFSSCISSVRKDGGFQLIIGTLVKNGYATSALLTFRDRILAMTDEKAFSRVAVMFAKAQCAQKCLKILTASLKSKMDQESLMKIFKLAFDQGCSRKVMQGYSDVMKGFSKQSKAFMADKMKKRIVKKTCTGNHPGAGNQK